MDAESTFSLHRILRCHQQISSCRNVLYMHVRIFALILLFFTDFRRHLFANDIAFRLYLLVSRKKASIYLLGWWAHPQVWIHISQVNRQFFLQRNSKLTLPTYPVVPCHSIGKEALNTYDHLPKSDDYWILNIDFDAGMSRHDLQLPCIRLPLYKTVYTGDKLLKYLDPRINLPL